LHEEAARLAKEEIKLLFTMSTPATLAAKKVTEDSQLPVVFGPVSSPIKAGIVKSLSQHQGNITGVTFGPQEPKRLKMLLNIVPGIQKIWVPYNPDDKSPKLGLQRLVEPAAKLGIEIVQEHVRSKKELLSALENYPEDVDAIFIPTDSLMVALSDILISFSIQHQIPLSSPQREAVRRGALCSYGFSIFDVGKQASLLVVKILEGASPSSIPVELSEFVLAINLKTAEAINVDVPGQLLRHAVVYRDIGTNRSEE
jgi:putative ABC transport system substrate-binding protein